ncbi:MAG: CotH kinase family protein [Crocinitomicaceae bacterium]|nr:CotH kinase family protein [Crocinitomicaceae bacterium]
MLNFRTLIILLSTLLLSTKVKSQDLFNSSIIHEIEINFYDANWDHLLDSLATLGVGTGSGTERILADVVIDGLPYDSCGVRYKGNSSMDTTSNKNPFNIDLNYIIAGQDHQGKDKIKLANCYSDPSMVREILMYELSNQYMDCPRASFVKLYINGDYRGIYTNTESIDNEFLDQYYGSSNNSFFKCDPISFQIFGDNSNLAFHPDTMAYDTLYNKKSDYGLAELQTLTLNLEFNPNNIENHLDVDRVLWFLAVSSAFVHNDGYTAFAHNYYVYKMDNGIWSIILWDVNMSFGGLPFNGTGILPLGHTALSEQDPFIHIGSPNLKPLIAKLLTIPKYRRMYVAHFRTIMEENVNNDHYLQRAEFFSALIDADVQNEPYSSYTYTQFQNNVYTDVGLGWNYRPGLEHLMSARETYIYTIADFQYNPPIITNVTAPSTPLPYTTISVTAEVTNATNVQLGYRHDKFDVFTKIQMFDDGAHNDGASGDGVYGVDISLNATDLQYYIYAENADAGSFSPVRAEYEYYIVSPQKSIVINELMAVNSTTQADPSGDYDDWIELYNNSSTAISLDGYHISDDASNLNLWPLPSVTLQPGDFFIIWADNETTEPGVHANFKLSGSGESLYLTDDLGFLLDQVDFPQQSDDISYARFPNGTGNFTFMYPTFSSENTTIVGIEKEVEKAEISIYPNPATEYITVTKSQNKQESFIIFDISGNVIHQGTLSNTATQIDVSEFSAGLYLIRFESGETEKLIIR